MSVQIQHDPSISTQLHSKDGKTSPNLSDSVKPPSREPPLTTPSYDYDHPSLPSKHTLQWSELSTTEMTSTFQDPSQELFSRAVAALLDSRKVSVTHSAFDHLIIIAEEYLCGLIEELKKSARIQRRTTPSISDALVLLRLSGLHLSLLDEECEKEREMPTILPEAWTEIELSMLPPVDHDSTDLFLTARGSDVASLVPSQKQRGGHIPKWMPPFPPDHTFMTTPSLPERVTDPRALREMIVQEGQLAEHALRRLTGVIKVDETAHDDDADDVETETVTETVEIETETKTEVKEIKEEVPVLVDTNGSAPVRPLLALKLSLGEPTDSAAVPPKKIDPTGKPVSVTKEKATFGPFDLGPSTSKKFDIVEYVQKRAKIVQKWKARDSASSSSSSSNGGSRVNWNAILTNPSLLSASSSSSAFVPSTANGPTSEPETDPLRQEDTHPSGLGSAPTLVEHEYNLALAKIQKSKDDEARKESIVDTGIVNWERERYTWA